MIFGMVLIAFFTFPSGHHRRRYNRFYHYCRPITEARMNFSLSMSSSLMRMLQLLPTTILSSW